jgi:hypothetical protein
VKFWFYLERGGYVKRDGGFKSIAEFTEMDYTP